jgi:hypothetical protein
MDRNQLLNDQETSLRLALDGRQSTIWTALPCIVQSVDYTAMTLECQPAIQGTTEAEDGTITFVNLPLLVDVPITYPSAGGFILTFPIKANDEVLVIIASRCIDAWWQSGGVQKPIEMRMHDLSDSFAIPGPRSQPNVVSGISTTDVQLRNDAGDTYLSVTHDGKIKIVSGSSIDITGDVTVSGKITATGEVTGNGVALSTHQHIAGGLIAPPGGGAVTGDTGAPL